MATPDHTAHCAAREGAPALSRRTLLRATPAAALGLLPLQAVADAATPVLRLFREWEAEQDLLVGPVGRALSEEDFDARVDRHCALERRMAAEPSECLADLAAKIVSCCGQGDFAPYEEIWRECEAILAGGAA